MQLDTWLSRFLFPKMPPLEKRFAPSHSHVAQKTKNETPDTEFHVVKICKDKKIFEFLILINWDFYMFKLQKSNGQVEFRDQRWSPDVTCQNVAADIMSM